MKQKMKSNIILFYSSNRKFVHQKTHVIKYNTY